MPKIAYLGDFLPFLDPLHTIKTFFHKISHKIAHSMSSSISHKIFPQDFPARISCKIFPQDFPARISHKIFPQAFPARISHKIFPQEFATRFSCKLFLSWILIGWLPITLFPNAKFPPITALLNRPTYHKRSKVSPPPFPQILWEPQINE